MPWLNRHGLTTPSAILSWVLMAEEEDKHNQDKFDFDQRGEALAWISMDQARVLAIQHVRDNTDF